MASQDCMEMAERNHGTLVHKDGSLQRIKIWGLPARGLHVACGWSVVQLDHDEELGPMHGMYGTLEAGLEVQRTIKRAELMALLCLLKKVIGHYNGSYVEKMNHWWVMERRNEMYLSRSVKTLIGGS